MQREKLLSKIMDVLLVKWTVTKYTLKISPYDVTILVKFQISVVWQPCCYKHGIAWIPLSIFYGRGSAIIILMGEQCWLQGTNLQHCLPDIKLQARNSSEKSAEIISTTFSHGCPIPDLNYFDIGPLLAS